MPGILWALRTIPSFATKKTSFTLAFGHETVILAFAADDNDERLRVDLYLIDEIENEAQVRAIARRQSVANFYNTKVRSRTFLVDDLVLQNSHGSRHPQSMEN